MVDTAESGNKMASEGTKKDDPDLESTLEPLVLCKENGSFNFFCDKIPYLPTLFLSH